MTNKAKIISTIAILASLWGSFGLAIMNNPAPLPNPNPYTCIPTTSNGATGCSLNNCVTHIPWAPSQGYYMSATYECCYNSAGVFQNDYAYKCTAVPITSSSGSYFSFPNWGCCDTFSGNPPACNNSICANQIPAN